MTVSGHKRPSFAYNVEINATCPGSVPTHLSDTIRKGGFFMRRSGKSIGYYIAGAGLVVIIAVILPCTWWWLFIGLALILIGFLLLRC
jgi:hypothetical protein